LLVGAVDFVDSLQVVAEAVDDAEFLSVDAEFSGLFGDMLYVTNSQLLG